MAVMTVVAAVTRELEAISERDPALAVSAEAATALALAAEMDSDSSATSKSMCARALNETMAVLRSKLPPETAQDALDELTSRRAARLTA